MSRLVYQFGLPRSGLYAIAEWYIDGIGEACQHQIGGGFKDIYASVSGSTSHVITIEALPIKYVQEGLVHCEKIGAETWVQLRDPYNWLSSLQQGINSYAIAWRPDSPLGFWKDYARHCLNCASYLNYNRWFSDQNYRSELAERLAFQQHRNGEAWEHVPGRGGGSSFDGERFANQAQAMAVLERYARFVDDASFCAQFDDEVIALAEQLFDMKRPW
jgi:hypothetical protein